MHYFHSLPFLALLSFRFADEIFTTPALLSPPLLCGTLPNWVDPDPLGV